MSFNAGSLIYQIEASTSGFNEAMREINSKAQDVADRVGSKMRDFGAGMSKVGAGISATLSAPLALFAKQSLQAWSDQDIANKKVEAGIKATGGAAGFTADELGKLAENLQKVTVYSDEDILDKVTNNLLTFPAVAGDVFKRTQVAATDLAATLNTDLKGVTIALGKALENPDIGVGALRRWGVTFSKEEMAVIKDLNATGEKIKAQTMILDAIEKQYGGKAEAVAKAGLNPLKVLKNQFGEVMEQIGGDIAKVLPDIVKAVSSIVSALQAMSPEMRQFIIIAGGLAIAFGPLLTALGGIAFAIGGLAPLIPLIVSSFGVLGSVVLTLSGAFQALAIAILANPLVALGVALVAAGAAIYVFRDQIAEFLSGAWSSFKEAFPQTAALIETAFGIIKSQITSTISIYTQLATKGIEAVQALYEGVKTWLLDRLSAIFDSVKAKISSVGDAFYGLWDRVVGHSYVPDMVDGISNEFARLDDVMVKPTLAATSKASEAFKALGETAAASMGGKIAAGVPVPQARADNLPSDEAKALEKQIDQTQQKIDSMFDSFGSGLAEAVTGTKKWNDVFKELAMSVIKLGIGNLFKSGGGSGGDSGGSGFGGFLGGILGSIFGGKAIGGNVSAGHIYPVNERGMEYFRPKTAGTIIPAGKVGGGGTTIVMNNDFSGADPASEARIFAQLERVKREAVQMSVRAMQSGRASDPSFFPLA